MFTVLRHLGFWSASLLWLPLGIVVFAAIRGTLLPLPLEIQPWMSLLMTAPFGLPLALASHAIWKEKRTRTAWTTFLILAPITIVATLFAGLLGPLAIAICAIIFSLPAWALYAFLRFRRAWR